MFKKESKKKELERKPLNNNVKLLSIVILNNSYNKRGIFNIKTSQNLFKVQNQESRGRRRRISGES